MIRRHWLPLVQAALWVGIALWLSPVATGAALLAALLFWAAMSCR